ncbi:hypothetical protein H9Q72_007841 [Fusarium xylarioides]|uniref:Uncharacterized protein n=1 Tax=Fusarium xylarioides TaxID=221167 RepID=A0A9P7HYA4_9HYPO|nr:hypothetical protein H9Q72_007841 [Fusarium xylarioides]
MFTLDCIPPEDPPGGTPTPYKWQCHRCNQEYKLSVTSRCIKCPSYNSTPPYKYLSGESSDGGPTRQYQQSPLSGNNTPDSRSTTGTEMSPKSRKYSKRPSRELYNYDYEFWDRYNDWKRFRSEYEARPESWESRIKRSFDGLDSVQGRAKRYKFEVESRTCFTEERLERMLQRRQNCELDCNYPSQCHRERYEAFMKTPSKVTGGTFHPTYYDDEDDEMPGKLPLCELLPQFDQEITSPEDADEDEDEIFAAYKRDVDAWYASTLAKSS